MKAKIKALIILISIFTVTLIAGIVSACKIGEITPMEQAQQMGYTCPVTYYANGGTFYTGSDGDLKVYRTVYYRPDVPIWEIPFSRDREYDLSIDRPNYVFTGWQKCKLVDGKPELIDADGNILEVLENGTADIKQDNGLQEQEQNKRFTATPSGEDAFANGPITLHDGDDWLYLAATWVQDVVVDIKLVTDTDIVVGDKTYKTGDVISTKGFGTGTSTTVYPEVFESPAELGYTHSYIHLYEDEACTKLIPVSTGKTFQKDDEEKVVYAKYIEGIWRPVRTPNDVYTMLSATGTTGYYVVDDIDCSVGRTNFYLRTTAFNGIIEGNGCTISNINIGQSTIQTIEPGRNASLFGELGENAKIHDLTIDTVKINVQPRAGAQNVNIYLVIAGMADGAVIDGLEVKNATLDVTIPTTSKVLNMMQIVDEVEVYNKTDNWLYGTSSSYSTDAEFVEVNYEVVENVTLIINNQTLIGGQQ